MADKIYLAVRGMVTDVRAFACEAAAKTFLEKQNTGGFGEVYELMPVNVQPCEPKE